MIKREVPMVRQKFDYEDWMHAGFESRQDCIDWSSRACGIACVAMAAKYFRAEIQEKSELLHVGVKLQGYSSRGWVHVKLAELCEKIGLRAVALEVEDLQTVQEFLESDRLFVASVAEKFPVDGTRGGHLVLIKGYDEVRKELYFNDPSAWGQAHEKVSIERFLFSFAKRGIAIWRD